MVIHIVNGFKVEKPSFYNLSEKRNNFAAWFEIIWGVYAS